MKSFSYTMAHCSVAGLKVKVRPERKGLQLLCKLDSFYVSVVGCGKFKTVYLALHLFCFGLLHFFKQNPEMIRQITFQ